MRVPGGVGVIRCDPACMTSRLDAAAICTPGLESFVEAELRALGIKPKPGAHGVVSFRATTRQLYVANVWLRTASRVLVRLATFRATDFAHLQMRASEVDWAPWIGDDIAPEFRVTSHKSKLYHTEGIAQRLHKTVGPASRGEPVQPFVVRFEKDLCTISVDTGGTPLNHRGWRRDIGVAPLRPTMAAAMLMSAGYDGSHPLADPFCGSGTIVIEAALMAKKLPPGGTRRFAFQTWPTFEAGTWASVQGEVKATADPGREVVIEASDRDSLAVEITEKNAKRAGVGDVIRIEKRVVSHLEGRTGPGWIVTNPPYGKRVGDGDLLPLYKRFGAILRERRPEFSLTLVANDRALARAADGRLHPAEGFGGSFGHGGIKVQVLSRPGSAAPESPTDSSAPSSAPQLPAPDATG